MATKASATPATEKKPKAKSVTNKAASTTSAAAEALTSKAPTSKAPAAKSAASKTAKAGQATPANPAVDAKPALAPLAPDQRRYYIEVAAYYIAERRGFHGGSELDDWAQAEAEIDRLLSEGILNP